VGAVIVILAGAVAGYAYYLNHEIHRVNIKNLSAQATAGADQGTQNILMLGSTSRCALKVQNPAYGLCSQGVNGINSDVIMILHLNPNTRTASILSIPRDLYIPNARSGSLLNGGPDKIDNGLYDGPSQLINSIQEDFGIPVNGFVELNFDSFMNIVNALGGIEMYFPMPVYDAYSGLNMQTTGCKYLNGTMALQVVRARHLQYKGPGVTSTNPANWPYEVNSDLGRIQRDHEFLRVLATKVRAKGIDNPVTDEQLMSALAPQLTVSQNIGVSQLVNWALTYHSVNIEKSPQLTLPVIQDALGPLQNFGNAYGDVEFPSEVQDQQVIDQFLGLSPTDNTMTGKPLPSPGSVTVSVMNGTGVTDQATQTSQALQALGFKIGTVGDVNSPGDPSETYVFYSSSAPSEVAAAQTVAHAFGGGVVMGLEPSMVTPGSQVTVVTGTDFSVNAPTAPASGAKGSSSTGSTATTAPSSSSSTTPGASNSQSGAFTTPSASNPKLSPWDPRSCTPSGGEGP